MKQIKVELQEFMGSDRKIAEAAWTSSLDKNLKEARTDEDIKRVINLLATEKHSVPFESVIFRFWIKTPIAIDRQLVVHRVASHSGMSGRYRTMPTEYLDIPDDVISITDKIDNYYFKQYGVKYRELYKQICSKANSEYSFIMAAIKDDKSRGVINNEEYKRLREFFRGMLPQHNMTERVTVINLRSWSNFYRLRSSSHAQPEIQYIASLMHAEIKAKNVCPIALEALEANNWQI